MLAAAALLEGHADPNARILIDLDGNWRVANTGPTLLMVATAIGTPDTVELLLARGADPRLKDWERRTAVDWLARRDDPVRRSGPPSRRPVEATGCPASVSYESGNGTATAGQDYTATSGIATFAIVSVSGATQTIVVPILDDLVSEGSETFAVSLATPIDADLGPTSAQTVTITDNEAVPALSIADVTVTEGDGATFVSAVAERVRPEWHLAAARKRFPTSRPLQAIPGENSHSRPRDSGVGCVSPSSAFVLQAGRRATATGRAVFLFVLPWMEIGGHGRGHPGTRHGVWSRHARRFSE